MTLKSTQCFCCITGGQCVKELRIHVQTTNILYGVITFNYLKKNSHANIM